MTISNSLGAQNKSTRPRKLPTQTSPPGQTFGELLPNEWTPAGPLLAAGSLRAYATSLICEVDNTRQQDQRRAVVLASWAVVRPELSLHDAIVQAAAEVAALCIHADSLSDILHTQRMPVQDDDNAKKLATAIRSSSLAIQGRKKQTKTEKKNRNSCMTLRFRRAYAASHQTIVFDCRRCANAIAPCSSNMSFLPLSLIFVFHSKFCFRALGSTPSRR